MGKKLNWTQNTFEFVELACPIAAKCFCREHCRCSNIKKNVKVIIFFLFLYVFRYRWFPMENLWYVICFSHWKMVSHCKYFYFMLIQCYNLAHMFYVFQNQDLKDVIMFQILSHIPFFKFLFFVYYSFNQISVVVRLENDEKSVHGQSLILIGDYTYFHIYYLYFLVRC